MLLYQYTLIDWADDIAVGVFTGTAKGEEGPSEDAVME